MRKQLYITVETLMDSDEKVITLLGDIGVWSFRNAMKKYPTRVYNIGILEQSTISMAAGLSLVGLIPIVHTIAPFLVERAYEQLKVDFGYQNIGGNFISTGGSYDYAGLGSTHHCPADVPILKNIPNMQIVLPGTAKEFNALLRKAYNNGSPTYYRLSETNNNIDFDVKLGEAIVVKKGEKATIIAVGAMLKEVLEATNDLDVTVLYYTTVAPFDKKTLYDNCRSGKVLLCEPYYYGALTTEISDTLGVKMSAIDFVGVPHEFVTKYGTTAENSNYFGLTAANIRKKTVNLLAMEEVH